MAKKIKKETKKSLAVSPLAKPKSEKELVKKTKITVIGIGGGGGNIVSEIASKIERATFVTANTDRQALKTTSRKAIHFQFGQNLTQGLGTGMNAELGELAAQNERERIKKLLEGQDLCIIVACLGGGTGSGAAPIFAKISKKLGNITYGFFTLPFKLEGEKKMEIARAALEKLKPRLNSFAIIPNERIFQIVDKSTPLKQALSAINKNLAESLQGLIETIYQPGLINIDFADLKTILDRQGRLTYLNTVEVQGKNKTEEAIKKVLNNPLYPYGIRGAKGVLFNISGEKNLALSEINQISKTISELTNKEAKIIFGLAQPKIYQNTIKITLLATGLSTSIFSGEPKKPKIVRRPLPKRKKTKKITPKKKRKIKKPQGKPNRLKTAKRLRPTHHPLTRQPSLKRKKRKKNKSRQKKVRRALKVLSALVKIKTRKKPKKVKKVSQTKKSIINPPQVRKNALQIKKEVEEEEKDIEAKEKFWETPAFLRQKLGKGK